MANGTIEDRVERLERSVERLLAADPEREHGNWLEGWFGAFRNSPNFERATERGAEYRRSQSTPDDEPNDVSA